MLAARTEQLGAAAAGCAEGHGCPGPLLEHLGSHEGPGGTWLRRAAAAQLALAILARVGFFRLRQGGGVRHEKHPEVNRCARGLAVAGAGRRAAPGLRSMRREALARWRRREQRQLELPDERVLQNGGPPRGLRRARCPRGGSRDQRSCGFPPREDGPSSARGAAAPTFVRGGYGRPPRGRWEAVRRCGGSRCLQPCGLAERRWSAPRGRARLAWRLGTHEG
mmetsp:Transcript_80366/g.233338  ORF Transcript_80366/g.233338 Transcript_80366/m.233338 type:complete len:222 (+) Transcript_80366:199-864(+)